MADIRNSIYMMPLTAYFKFLYSLYNVDIYQTAPFRAPAVLGRRKPAYLTSANRYNISRDGGVCRVTCPMIFIEILYLSVSQCA